MPEFYEDINDYLEGIDNSKSVSAKGLDEYIYKVCAHTTLDYDNAAIVVRLFFHEIRNAMLRGNVVGLTGLGKFLISSPKVSGNKRVVCPIFKPYSSLSKDDRA